MPRNRLFDWLLGTKPPHWIKSRWHGFIGAITWLSHGFPHWWQWQWHIRNRSPLRWSKTKFSTRNLFSRFKLFTPGIFNYLPPSAGLILKNPYGYNRRWLFRIEYHRFKQVHWQLLSSLCRQDLLQLISNESLECITSGVNRILKCPISLYSEFRIIHQ